LTTETPGKVLGWLAAAMFSLALLFVVSGSDASFGGTRTQLADPFAPQKVVSVVDRMAAGYSQFLSVNFLKPLVYDYSIYADNAVWALKESGLAYSLGINRLLEGTLPPQGQVAGTSISQQTANLPGAFGIDNIYSLLIR
jgi:hypothetical protein